MFDKTGTNNQGDSSVLKKENMKLNFTVTVFIFYKAVHALYFILLYKQPERMTVISHHSIYVVTFKIFYCYTLRGMRLADYFV